MKILLVIILCSALGLGQSKTTDKDRNMVEYIKKNWATANQNNYKEVFGKLINDCEQYLVAYPETSIKNGILGYLFEMKAAAAANKSEIVKAADLLVKNDKSVKTSIRAGQVLIEKGIDDKKGIEILKKILPSIKDSKQFYDANLLLASGEMHLKNYNLSIKYLRSAVGRDPGRVDAYKGLKELYSLTGNKNELAVVSKKIAEIEVDPNINVDLSSFGFMDISGNDFIIGDFKGQRVALVFFSFECSYCKKELPVIKNLIEKYNDLKFIFINLEENVSEIKNKYLLEEEFSFMQSVTIAKFGAAFDKILDITITPQVLLLDKNSIVKYDYRGYLENFAEKFKKDISTLQ